MIQKTMPTDTPGVLRGDVYLRLHTQLAQRLLHGRPRRADQSAILGLLGFAERIRLIWQAVQQDDPYADWYLLRIGKRLHRADTVLGGIKAELNAVVERSALEWETGASITPLRVPLRFATPYAYRGAMLLSQLDQVARVVMTSRYLGVITPKSAATYLQQGSRVVRGAYASVHGYRVFAINRDDVISGTERARQARDLMGEVPAEVVAMEQLAELRPHTASKSVNEASTSLSRLISEPVAKATGGAIEIGNGNAGDG